MDEGKLSIMCRVCLRYDSENGTKLLSLFETCNNSVIVGNINSVTNVDIQEGDGLPDKICPECLLELDNAINFKLKCENSNAILRNIKLCNSIDIHLDIKQEENNYEEDSHYEKLIQESDIKCTLTDQPQSVMIPIKNEGIENNPDKLEKPSRAIDLKLECHDCGGSFPSKCKLRVHWKKAHKPKLICSECKRLFKSFKAYHIHRKKPTATCKAVSQSRIEGEGKSRVFNCKSCLFKTKRAKDIAIHQRTHSGERPYKCDICKKTFSQQGSMDDHMEVAHNMYRFEYTCQHCGKFIKGRHRFYSHMRIHRRNSVQCHICNKLYKETYLPTHMLRHGDTKQSACEYCAATFYTGSELRNHIRQTHLKGENYTCDICGYKAARNSIIKRHKSKHTETNIPCLVCGAFLENEQLFKKHEQRHIDRPYSCPHCEANFHGKKYLSKHIRMKHVLLAGKPTKDVFVKKEHKSTPNVNVINN